MTDLTKKLTDSPAQLANRFQGYTNQAQQGRDERRKKFLDLVGGQVQPEPSAYNSDLAGSFVAERNRQQEARAKELNKKDPVSNFVTTGFKGGPVIDRTTYDKGLLDVRAKNKQDMQKKLPDVAATGGSSGGGGGPLASDTRLGYGSRGRIYSPNRDLIRARKLKRLGAPEAARALEMRYALGPDYPAVQSANQRRSLEQINKDTQKQQQLNMEIMKAAMATNLNQNRFDRVNIPSLA